MDTEPGTKVVPNSEGLRPFYFVTFPLTEQNPAVSVCLTTGELADRVGPACSQEALEDLTGRLTDQMDENQLRTAAEESAAEIPSDAHRPSGTQEVIEAFGALSEPQFRHIGQLLGERLGRYKDWSTHRAFGPMTTETASAVCAYLRDQAITHDRETTTRWSSLTGSADQPPAAAAQLDRAEGRAMDDYRQRGLDYPPRQAPADLDPRERARITADTERRALDEVAAWLNDPRLMGDPGSLEDVITAVRRTGRYVGMPAREG